METINHVLLEYENSDWDHLEELRDLLTLSTEGSEIFICHPRYVLDAIVENPTTTDIIAVDFDSVNVQKMLDHDDFGHYSIVGQISFRSDNQMTYLVKRAQHMLREHLDTGAIHHSCPFAIIEKSYNGSAEPQYSVRGLVSCRQDGFSIASNPLAMRKDLNEDECKKEPTL